MPSLSRMDLLRLARAGAEARVTELRRELDNILRSFPDLRRGGRGRAVRANGAASRGGRGSRGGGRKRRGWTAAQRRAVAARMKRYWAARRAQKK